MSSSIFRLYDRTQTSIHRLIKRDRLSRTSIRFPNYVCNSIGGVASTSVFNFLEANLPKVTENRFQKGVSLWKHTLYPPVCPTIRKAIFVYGDPVSATASLFRRNLANAHLANKGLPSFPISFEEYLKLPHDVFRTGEHMENWTNEDQDYPILCVKSEAVFEKADEICDFFGIERNRSSFPERKERTIQLELEDYLGSSKYNRLLEMLEHARTLYSQKPDLFIVGSPKSASD